LQTVYRVQLDGVVYLLERQGAGLSVRMGDGTRVASLLPTQAQAENGDELLARRLFEFAKSQRLI
jgi:hypothetical protein